MTTGTVDTPEVEKEAPVGDRVTDTCRHAAELSHEARLVKSLASDAIDDGVHAAKRVIKSVRRGVEELGNLRDEAVHRVKRQPLKAMGIALGVGLLLGLAVGWFGHRPGRRE